MDKEENLDELLIAEIKKAFEGENIIELPKTINVEQDDVPDIERWRTHE